jgi:hypothetical protein
VREMIFNDSSSSSEEGEDEEQDNFEMAMAGILNEDFWRMRLGSQSNVCTSIEVE